MEEHTNTAVVDASCILNLLLPDEETGRFDSYLLQYKNGEIKLIAPVLLEFEVGNALRSAVLKKRVTRQQGEALFEAFLNLSIESHPLSYKQVFKTSLTHNLSFYDAAYLYLAREFACPLLTLDSRLHQAMSRE